MEMKSCSEFLSSSVPVYVGPDTRLSDAVDAMQIAQVDTLWVMNSGVHCGELHESDVLRHVSQNGGLSRITVATVMRELQQGQVFQTSRKGPSVL